SLFLTQVIRKDLSFGQLFELFMLSWKSSIIRRHTS
uniref:Uncharacterized protein n=1 Tax=Amphimedon queenslandica TaxID=400682 RepID=A0A1X7SI62_AMPQE